MHSTCTDKTTRAAFRYVSPATRPLTLEETGIRSVAYAIKEPDCEQAIIDFAAAAMAKLIEQDEIGYLIPVPNHLGDTTANRRIASAIVNLINTEAANFIVSDLLTRTVYDHEKKHASQCENHRARRAPLQPDEIRIVRKSPYDTGIRLTGVDSIYFVDNVITSGNTIEACRRVFFGLGTGLVFADAHRDAGN